MLFFLLLATSFGCSSDGNANPDIVEFLAELLAIDDDVVAQFDVQRDAVAAGTERNINWDGAAVTVLTLGATADFPSTLFRDGAGNRQIMVGGATGEASAVSEDSFATLPDGSPNPSAGGGFGPLTGTVNFAVLGKDNVTVSFTTIDTAEAGLVNGFGVIFTDVEAAGKSGLRFYDREGRLLRDVRAVPGASGAHQFVGAVFQNAVVATVRIDMGDNRNFGTGVENPAGGGDDFVVVDDFRFFLAQDAVAPTAFVAPIASLADDVFVRFDRRRLPLAQGRERNINWDGGAVTALTLGATTDFPPALFLNGAGLRQINIGDAGQGVVVSEDSFATLPDASANPSAGQGFGNVSPTVNFSVIGGNRVTVRFFLADQVTPALVHGFGAIFTDVELAQKSGLRFFDANDNLLLDVRAAAGASGASQFVGGVLGQAVVARVEIDFGDNGTFGTATENPGAGIDQVVVDDFRFFQSDIGQ